MDLNEWRDEVRRLADEDKASWLQRPLTPRTPSSGGEGAYPKKYSLAQGVPRVNCSRFFPLDKIGSGAQAEVFRLKTEKAGFVAVKVLRSELASNPRELATFQREVNVVGRLSHPNIASLFGIGTVHGQPCAVLEFCDTDICRALRLSQVGESKSIRRRVLAEYPSLDRLKIVRDFASAMTYLHCGSAVPGCAVLHRDLKPDNLGLKGKKLKLLDFGLAVLLQLTKKQTEAKKRKSRTIVDDMLYDLSSDTGTRRYFAPEIGRSEPYGPPADVYSFGIVAWEILVVGGKPFAGLNASQHYSQVCRRGQRPKIPTTWDPSLANLISAVWHHDPLRRPSFPQIHSALDAIISNLDDSDSEDTDDPDDNDDRKDPLTGASLRSLENLNSYSARRKPNFLGFLCSPGRDDA